MYANGFDNTWHYPPQYRVGLEFNRNILSCRLYSLKLQHPWIRSNIPHTALEPSNEIHCLESKDSAPNKEPHSKLISPICLSPLQLKVCPSPLINSEKTEHSVSTNKKSPEYLSPLNTYIKQNTTKNKQTDLTTGYTLCDVKTEDTIRHNIALMTSKSRVYIPLPPLVP